MWPCAAVAVLCALAAGLIVSPAVAANGSWNMDLGGSWTSGTNWLNGTIPGTAGGTNSTDIATFGFTLTTGRQITVDANRNVGGIMFSNTSASAYTLITGTLRLSSGGVIQTALGNGNHTDTITAPIVIQGDGGSATFTAGATSTSSVMRFTTNPITGVSTAGNTTTLTLNGDNTSNNNRIDSNIGDGTAGGKLAVVKSGNGSWMLGNTQSFTGGLTLSGGRLVFNADNRLGGGTVTFNGGALGSDSTTVRSATNAILFTGSGTIDRVTLSGPVDLGGATRIVSTTSSPTLSGVISNGGLTKAGAGLLTLTNANTYTGATTVSTGTLTIGDGATAGSIASSASIAIDAGATLNFSRTDDYGGSYSSPISGAGTLRLASGTLSLTGNNASFSGPVTVAGGTLSPGSANSLGTGTVSFTASGVGIQSSSAGSLSLGNTFLLSAASGSVSFTGNNSISAGQLIAAAATPRLNNMLSSDKTLTFSSLTGDGSGGRVVTAMGSGNTTVTNGVLNSGTWSTGFIIDSTGTTTIGGTSTFTGVLTQNAGRLVINSPLLGSTGTYGGDITANGIMEYTSSGTTIFSSGGNMTGAGSFVVNGAGVWFNRANIAYSGTVSVLAGKYIYSNQVGAGTGTLVLGNGIIANGTSTAVTLRNPLLVFAGSPTFGDATNTGPIAFLDQVTGSTFNGSVWKADLGGAMRTLTVVSTTATIPHVVSNGGITKNGPGVLVLSNTNTFSGTTRVNAGTLSLNGNSRGLQNSIVDLGGSGTLTNYSTTPVFGGVANYGSFSFPGTVTRLTINVLSGGTQTYSTLPGGGAANIGFGKEGGGTLVFGGNFNYTGVTNVDDGVLEVASVSAAGQPGPLGSGTTINLGSGSTTGTFRYVGATAAATDRIFNLAGTSGGGGIDASGAGALTITNLTVSGSVSRVLTLAGSSTAANSIGAIPDVDGIQSGTLSVVKDGPGLWRLTGSSSSEGSFTIRNGTIVAAVDAGDSGFAGAFGKGVVPIVGDTDAGATGTAALLAGTMTNGMGVSIKGASVATGGGAQKVLLGGGNTSGTSTFSKDAAIKLGRPVTLASSGSGVVDFVENNWQNGTGTGTPTVDVTFGAAGYTGTVRLSGTLATSGSVAVRYGTALIGGVPNSVPTLLSGAGTVTVDSGATLGGVGTVAATLGGGGLVGPGNSPGILTAEAVDASGGLDWAFEFSGTAPTYTSNTASVNDILRLTGTSPFLGGALNGGNVVSLYLPATAAAGDVFTGGFFSDMSTATFNNFLTTVQSGSFVAYYLDAGGSFSYGGQQYSLLANQVTVGTTTVPGTTNFQTGGSATDGQVTTFTVVVPEPGAIVLAGLGVAITAWTLRRRKHL